LQYLLDTNICVFVIRQKPAVVLQHFRQFQPDDLAISVVTLAELRYGADKSSDPVKNHSALDGFLAALSIVDFDPDAADWYGKSARTWSCEVVPLAPWIR
jgi:tRNA(fMet)-specific endonuclease VapC